MNRKLVSAGLLAGLAAGSGAGLIMQQTGVAGAAAVVAQVADSTAPTDTTDTTDTSTDSSTETAATSADRPSRAEQLTEALQPLVDDGTLTAEQLDAVVAALDAAGAANGRSGGGHHGGRGAHGGRRFGLEAAATALGITAEELRDQLEAGTTIAAVATAQGIDVQLVVDAMVADATERLAERVAAGDLTQAEADAKLAELSEKVTDVVNNVRPARPARPTDASADTDATETSVAG